MRACKPGGVDNPIPRETNAVAKQIVDCAYRVHFELGPGLVERVYETCLLYELGQRGLKTQRQVGLPIFYRGIKLDENLRLDLVVNDAVVVELKVVEELLPIHTAQLLTYLRISGRRLGLLINFNVRRIKDGIKRVAL